MLTFAQDLSRLPTLAVSDLDKLHEPHVLAHSHVGRVPVQLAIQPTNTVTYFRAIMDVAAIPDRLRAYLPFFCSSLTGCVATCTLTATISNFLCSWIILYMPLPTPARIR